MTGIDATRMHEVLPQVVETIRDYAGLDPATDLVPVKPTAHYTMGGIPITVDGEVYIPTADGRQIITGMYAAGECSCVSVHGANRLGETPARRMSVRHSRRTLHRHPSGIRSGCRIGCGR